MILDSSALVAILRGEPEGPGLLRALAAADSVALSAATYLETAIVVDANRDSVLSEQLDEFIGRFNIEIAAVTEAEARLARRAYRNFGRGSGHPARLNFGDCFAYALSKTAGEPLLFKGDDFFHTDVESALK